MHCQNQGSDIQFCQFHLTFWPIPVYDFANIGIWFRQNWYMFLPISVYDFSNTRIWFCLGTFWIRVGLRSKWKILKTLWGLEICLELIKNKMFMNVPLNVYVAFAFVCWFCLHAAVAVLHLHIYVAVFCLMLLLL